MAHRAVLIAWRPQVVKRGRYHARNGALHPGEAGVTLQALGANFMPHQHAGIRRPVRLVAAGAALEPDRRVLVSEGAALVAVAIETPRLVGREGPRLRGPERSMRIV